MPDSRLRRFNFLQLDLKRFVELLTLPSEFHFAVLTINVGCGDRLLQSLAFGGDLRADIGHQSQTIRFELLASFCEVGLFGMKLLDQ